MKLVMCKKAHEKVIKTLRGGGGIRLLNYYKVQTFSLVAYMYASKLFFNSSVLLLSASFLFSASNLRLASARDSPEIGIPGPIVFSVIYKRN